MTGYGKEAGNGVRRGRETRENTESNPHSGVHSITVCFLSFFPSLLPFSLLVLFIFWRQASRCLCSKGWPWTLNLSLSISQMSGLPFPCCFHSPESFKEMIKMSPASLTQLGSTTNWEQLLALGLVREASGEHAREPQGAKARGLLRRLKISYSSDLDF